MLCIIMCFKLCFARVVMAVILQEVVQHVPTLLGRDDRKFHCSKMLRFQHGK